MSITIVVLLAALLCAEAPAGTIRERYYWFYGWTSSILLHDPPELHLVKVRVSGNNMPVHSTDGWFLCQEKGARGLWTPATLPHLPDMGTYEEELAKDQNREDK